MSSDCRRHNPYRATKGAFQRHDVRASLRRAIAQLKRTAPPSFDAAKPAAVTREAVKCG